MAEVRALRIVAYTKNDPTVKGRDPLVHVMFSDQWCFESFSFRPSDGPRIRAAIKLAEYHARNGRVTKGDQP